MTPTTPGGPFFYGTFLEGDEAEEIDYVRQQMQQVRKREELTDD